jgi:hypothetical protein
MGHAGWGEVYHRALELFAAEPIELRIAIGLGLALASYLLLEGLRTSLFPLKNEKPERAALNVRPVAPAAPAPKPEARTARATSIVAKAPKPFVARAKVRLIQPKIAKVRVKPFRGEHSPLHHAADAGKPAIMVTEDGAPFSPLSPVNGKHLL